MKEMASFVAIDKGITNKSGTISSATRMAIAQVPLEIMARITRQKNLITLARYDRSVLIEHLVAQSF